MIVVIQPIAWPPRDSIRSSECGFLRHDADRAGQPVGDLDVAELPRTPDIQVGGKTTGTRGDERPRLESFSDVSSARAVDNERDGDLGRADQVLCGAWDPRPSRHLTHCRASRPGSACRAGSRRQRRARGTFLRTSAARGCHGSARWRGRVRLEGVGPGQMGRIGRLTINELDLLDRPVLCIIRVPPFRHGALPCPLKNMPAFVLSTVPTPAA